MQGEELMAEMKSSNDKIAMRMAAKYSSMSEEERRISAKLGEQAAIAYRALM